MIYHPSPSYGLLISLAVARDGDIEFFYLLLLPRQMDNAVFILASSSRLNATEWEKKRIQTRGSEFRRTELRLPLVCLSVL